MNLKQCTYSPELEADCLQTSSSDTSQLSLWNLTNTPAKSLEKEQKKDGSQDCRCGKAMYECSIHPNTQEKWIAFMRDSLVKTLALLESAMESVTKQDRVYLERSFASLALFDLDTCSWKTSQESLISGYQKSYLNLPKTGLMLNGAVYQHPTLGQITTGIDGGVWLKVEDGKK